MEIQLGVLKLILILGVLLYTEAAIKRQFCNAACFSLYFSPQTARFWYKKTLFSYVNFCILSAIDFIYHIIRAHVCRFSFLM